MRGPQDRHRPRAVGAPVAALLIDPALRPALADLEAFAHAGRGIRITDSDTGRAELFRDGLTFECNGLAPATGLRIDTPLQYLALPAGFAAQDHALITLSPGAHLAGAAQLLPVVRVLAGLVTALSELPGTHAVAWLPARLAMAPGWFGEAVGVWLKGGPFPALALTALARSDRGLVSRGLAYFTGQEFEFTGKDGTLRETDARGAVRLTDWLVAHGRVDSPRQAELPGFGTVQLDLHGPDSLHARSL